MPRRMPWPEESGIISRATLAMRLKDARERLKLSKRDVELRISLGRSVLLSYENGRTPPPLQILMELAHLYGVAPGTFLDPDPVSGEDNELILRALNAQPGLRNLVLRMATDQDVYEQVREWMEVVTVLQKQNTETL